MSDEKDDIESAVARANEIANRFGSDPSVSGEPKGSGMFSGMGAMGGGMMTPGFLAAPQVVPPAPAPVPEPVEESAYDDFSKEIMGRQKEVENIVSKHDGQLGHGAEKTDFPTIDAAKNWALESIEKGAEAISFGSDKPTPDALTSQLHQLSPSNITPEIKAEAAAVMDPVQLKQWPAWFTKTDAQHRAEFEQKHAETTMAEKGKEAWNVGVGIGKGLLDVGTRFGSGVAKAGATFLKGPGTEGSIADPKEWQRWGTGIAKLATVPAVSVAESLESVVQTASNAFQNGLSATDWVNEQLPVEQGGITREEAFQNYLGRKRADEYYAGWKVTDPNVFTRVIMEAPKTRELAENMAYSLTSIWSPSVDDRIQRHNGDRDAAMREKQLDDLRDSQQLVSNFRKEAAQMVPDPDLTEAAGWTRFGMNPFDVYGRIGGAGMRGISKGIKAASRVGKTAEQIAAMEAEAAAKAFEAELKAAEAAKTPGWVEGLAGKVADKVEPAAAWMSARYSDLPESVQEGLAKMGSGMVGTPLTKTAAILANASVAAPRIAQAALAGRRLAAGGVEGGFEAGAKAATEAAAKTGLSPKAQQWLANKSIPAAKTLDWMAQNSMEMARGSVHGATLAAAVGILENKDIDQIADMMGQGIFLHLGGEVMGNMAGVSHGRYMGNLKRQRASAAKWFNELDPATQAHVRDLGNWDSYVESLKGLRDSAENKYAQRKNETDNVVYSGESPEKIQATQEKANDALIELNIRNAQVRNAEKANSDTQKMYRDNLNIGMADVMTALNGSSKAGRNVEMRFTTAEELAREVLANNRDKGLTDLELIELFNFVAGASAEFAFIAENGGKHTLTSGKTVDLYTPYKDRININIDSIKARMGSGESALNAFGHEAGHAFWNIKEFREGAAETYKELFGNQKFDERGNLIGGDPGLFSVEDLLNKFKDHYARGYDTGLDPSQLASMAPEQQKAEAAKRLAQKIGLWDPVMQELDPNKTAAYMRHEMMAELIQGGAQGGIKLGADPKPWLAPLVDWATVKQKNTKTGKKIRNAFGLTETAPWDSQLTGTRFTADQVESTRNALQAVSELNGDVAAAEIIPHAPITETQLRSNEAVANQFGEAFFAHEKVATVLDKDGNVIESRVVTDPNAMEGTFEHGVTETGDPELRQTAGYGPIPVETHAMSVPEGGRVTITSRIKRDASGGLASLTPDQAKALNKERANIIRKAILDAPDREYPGRMDAVSADGLSLGGRLSPKQIEAIKGLPETIIPFGLKRRILEFNDLLVRDDGDAMIGLYGQAMDRQGRYKSFAPKIVDFVPLGMRLSKDGNILFNMFSKTGMREKLRRWQRDTPELLSLWNGDGESFMVDVRKVLENWKPREGAPAGLPGETGLDADLNMAISKKNRVNDFLNIFRKTETESLTANPARTTMRRPARRLTKAEKLDEESSDPNTLIRSYRVDRFHDLEKSSDAPFRVNYGKALYNLMPAKSEVEQRPELPPAFEPSILKGLRSINASYMGAGAPTARLPLDTAETFVTRFKPRQNEEDAMVSHGFYSKAGTVLLDKMPNRASAAQLKGILDPQKGSGVKPEELKFSGINQFIDATQAEKGFVSKDDIRKWLKEDYAAEFATQTEFGDIGGTQYDKYALPGGENYKEVVLKVPGTKFKSSHFADVPNYVAHLRTAEHGTGLLVEEMQSDLHQKARDKGYKEPVPIEELLPKMEADLAKLKEDRTRIFEQYKRATKELRSMPGIASELTPEQKERAIVLRDFQQQFGDLNYEVNAAIDGVEEEIDAHKSGKKVTYRGSVPDAPFRKDWPLQLFKYALKDAVETGKEWVGWTAGEAQADRYSLANKIDTLAYDTVNQKLIASRAGSRVFDKSVPTSEVQNYVGKEIAEKLLSSKDRGNGMRMIFPEDMKIGGEGMKGFYDAMLPKEIGKYVKQWGAKVEPDVLNVEKINKWQVFDENGEMAGTALSEWDASNLASQIGGSYKEIEGTETSDKIWKIAITPEMRESVAGGQTRFMPSVAVVPERFTGTGEEEQRRGRYVEPPKAFKRFDISQYEPGGKFFNAETGEDLTNKSYENASIAVVNGKPMLVANNEAESTGTGPLFRTNLFKQKAGWKWVSEGAPDTSTIVSVEGQGKHLYALQADFQNGVKMARYEGKASEPRLRPTGRGELTVGEQIGTIDIRGREHPVYDRVIIGAMPEPMEAEAPVTRFMPAKEGALEGIQPELKEEERRFFFTTATERDAAIKQLIDKGPEGEREIEKINQTSILHALTGIRDINISIENSRGVYKGDKEVSAITTVKAKRGADMDAVRSRFMDLSKVFKQMEVLEENVGAGKEEMLGNVDENGFKHIHSAVVEIENVTPEMVEEARKKAGIDGMTMADGRVELLNRGDDNEFIERYNAFTQAIHDAGGNVRSTDTGVSAIKAYSENPKEYPGTVGYDDPSLHLQTERGAGGAGYGRLNTPLARKLVELGAVPPPSEGKRTYFEAKDVTKQQAKFQSEIAKVFDTLPDNDMGRELVQRAYSALAKEIKDQYLLLTSGPDGIQFISKPYSEGGEPYPNSEAAIRDIRENNQLVFLKTDPDAFGPAEADFSGHPLLEYSGLKDVNGVPLLYNDLFRPIHDTIAHGLFGATFGPVGEEAAFHTHIRTIKDPMARWALLTETRGQNSWVNYRPEMLNENGMPLQKGDEGYIPLTDRGFAVQKAALLPLEYALTGDREVDAPTLALMKQLGPLADGSFVEPIESAKEPEGYLSGIRFMPAKKDKKPKEKKKTAIEEQKISPQEKAAMKLKTAFVVDAGDSVSLPILQETANGKPKLDKNKEPKIIKLDYNLVDSPEITKFSGGIVEDPTKPDWERLAYDVPAKFQKVINAAIDSGAIDDAANRAAEKTAKYLQNPEIAAGKGWYSRMRENLLAALGEEKRELLSQLLGATSAKTPVNENFLQAMDGLEGIMSGRYDSNRELYLAMLAAEEKGELNTLINDKKYVATIESKIKQIKKEAKKLTGKKQQAAKTEISKLEELIAIPEEERTKRDRMKITVLGSGLMPLRSNGKKFNANSMAVMKVIAGTWLDNRNAPKTPNFAGNLSGRTVQATIDVWAARFLRQLLYENSGQPWRIQPKSEEGVSNEDFALGQVIMERTAKKLDMNPDDLQAVLWFAEKDNWEKQGWTKSIGAEKSSFDDIFHKFFPKDRKPLSFQEAIELFAKEKAKINESETEEVEDGEEDIE